MTFDGTKLTLANDASISGLTVGKGGGSVGSNVVLGSGAMAATATGGDSVAIGSSALASMTSGSANIGIGSLALTANDAGANNVGIGVSSLRANTSGGSNTALGFQSLRFNTTASNNTVVGYQALYTNSTGYDNVAIGYIALQSNTTAAYNIGIGSQAAKSNTTGTGIVAIGATALYLNTTGLSNTAIGSYDNTNAVVGAMYSNTTGSYNVAMGTGALKSNTTASNNTAVGYQAGYTSSTALYSTFLGSQAGYGITTTVGNTCIGYQAGYSSASDGNTFVGRQAGYNSTGTYNTFIGVSATTGYGAGYSVTSGNYNTIIGGYSGNQGGLDIRTANNYIVLSDGAGNPRGIFDGSGNYIVGGTVACNNTSNRGNITVNGSTDSIINLTNANNTNEGGYVYFDGTNIKIQSSRSSSKVYVTAQTNGVYLANGGTSWTSNSDERLKENLVPISDALNKVNTLRSVTGNYISDKEKQSKSFLIAQEVQAVLPEAVDASDPEKLGLAYTDVIPLLVAAIKELSAKVTALEAKLGA
jgi:hypothetical protein